MTVTELLAALQRALDTARDLNVPPEQRRSAADVLTYRVRWDGYGETVRTVGVDHAAFTVWLSS